MNREKLATMLGWAYAIPTIAHLILHPALEQGELLPAFIAYPIFVLVLLAGFYQLYALGHPYLYPQAVLTNPTMTVLSWCIGILAGVFELREGDFINFLYAFTVWFGLCQLVIIVVSGYVKMVKIFR